MHIDNPLIGLALYRPLTVTHHDKTLHGIEYHHEDGGHTVADCPNATDAAVLVHWDRVGHHLLDACKRAFFEIEAMMDHLAKDSDTIEKDEFGRRKRLPIETLLSNAIGNAEDIEMYWETSEPFLCPVCGKELVHTGNLEAYETLSEHVTDPNGRRFPRRVLDCTNLDCTLCNRIFWDREGGEWYDRKRDTDALLERLGVKHLYPQNSIADRVEESMQKRRESREEIDAESKTT